MTTAPQNEPERDGVAAVGALLDRRVRPLPPGEVWQPTPPDKPGAWWMLCGEADGKPALVRVEFMRGDLWAVDCAIGSLPVKMYHDGLTACLWQEA